MNLAIARNLKSLRVERGMRKDDVARDLGVSLETLRRYEKDGKNVTIEFLEKILNYYETDKYIFFKKICEFTHESHKGED